MNTENPEPQVPHVLDQTSGSLVAPTEKSKPILEIFCALYSAAALGIGLTLYNTPPAATGDNPSLSSALGAGIAQDLGIGLVLLTVNALAVILLFSQLRRLNFKHPFILAILSNILFIIIATILPGAVLDLPFTTAIYFSLLAGFVQYEVLRRFRPKSTPIS